MSEKKYVEANALIAECEEEIVDYDEDLQKHFIVNAVPTEYIEAFPAAEVEEIKHGRWVFTDTYDMYHTPIYSCSACYHETPTHYITAYSRCPHCGAKMDKEKI